MHQRRFLKFLAAAANEWKRSVILLLSPFRTCLCIVRVRVGGPVGKTHPADRAAGPEIPGGRGARCGTMPVCHRCRGRAGVVARPPAGFARATVGCPFLGVLDSGDGPEDRTQCSRGPPR